ncbi:MAG: hypothetical protein HDR24_11460 [Lachnospiraceae bacterium]|nr:hypothetical protein [Lachnospiraceae bacterium]
MKEITELVQVLLSMSTNTYLECKYTLLAVSKDNPKLNNFINVLFGLTDKSRPLLIEMK